MDLRDVAMGNLACSCNDVHDYKEKEETEITIQKLKGKGREVIGSLPAIAKAG